MDRPPTLLWLRRDLRLRDHPAWEAAVRGGGPVIPVYILDPVAEAAHGAASRWRLGGSLAALDRELRRRGSRLVLRRGEALTALRTLCRESGARRVVWSRLYDGASVARDKAIKSALTSDGIEAASVNATLLFEPWSVEKRSGGGFQVFTPFWRAVRPRDPGTPLPAPVDLSPPDDWPASEPLEAWQLDAAMGRGVAIVARHARLGEAAADDRLDRFLDERLIRYRTDRDRPDRGATSGLSENLAHGEISPRTIWHRVRGWMERHPGQEGTAETFLKELVWREFAYHLIFHTPRIETENWRPEWDDFPWRGDNDDARRWRQGRTGFALVDAGMREMYVTGRMHNRVRMVVASFLTKHLLTHWRIGAEWFRDCLTDWDPASNAMGWQWVAGSGPDAAPYFRIFNPETQADRFDPDCAYRNRWLAEGRPEPHAEALSFFDAVPRSWGLDPSDAPPAPRISLQTGRTDALAAYQRFRRER